MPSQNDLVRLYYIGGFVKPNAVVTARGNSYLIPEVGKYLEVPGYTARRLIRRNRRPDGVSVFTTDQRFANSVIAARERGADVPSIETKEYSREELLEMLAAMDTDTQAENSKPQRRQKAEDKEAA